LTGLFISPLDIARTRLIVQSSQARHTTYSGPIDGVQKLIQEEGGLSTTYFHSNLLLPAILDYSVRPLLHIATPLIIERLFGLSASENAAVYTIVEFCLHTATLLITLPIECIRKRLQLQSRAPLAPSPQGFKACVETRPTPYNGIVHAAYAIITEETAALPPHLLAKNRHRRAASEHQQQGTSADAPSMFGGLRQLYRGFGMACSAQAIVMVLSLVSGRDSDVMSGWAEM
jgi:fusion and transport protein UGO1